MDVVHLRGYAAETGCCFKVISKKSRFTWRVSEVTCPQAIWNCPERKLSPQQRAALTRADIAWWDAAAASAPTLVLEYCSMSCTCDSCLRTDIRIEINDDDVLEMVMSDG